MVIKSKLATIDHVLLFLLVGKLDIRSDLVSIRPVCKTKTQDPQTQDHAKRGWHGLTQADIKQSLIST